MVTSDHWISLTDSKDKTKMAKRGSLQFHRHHVDFTDQKRGPTSVRGMDPSLIKNASDFSDATCLEDISNISGFTERLYNVHESKLYQLQCRKSFDYFGFARLCQNKVHNRRKPKFVEVRYPENYPHPL